MKRKNKITISAVCVICAVMIAGCGSSGTAAERPAEEISQESESTDGYESDITEYDEKIELSDGAGTVTVSESGTYYITGSSNDCTVAVKAGESDSVTLILEDVSIKNSSSAAIYAESAGEVNIVLEGDSHLVCEEGFDDESEDIDAVIYSMTCMTISGDGSLEIVSGEGKGIGVCDSLVISGGDISIKACDDGINAGEDFLMTGGKLSIEAGDDGIHADAHLTVSGGDITIDGAEGIEATCIVIDDGLIVINASDDGINAAQKSEDAEVKVEINGGDITIVMGEGDTDGIDSNGDLIINGGRIDITGMSACDYDGTAELNGGTLIVNGVEADTITNQFMGGFPGPGGQFPEGFGEDFVPGEGGRPGDGIRPDGDFQPEM
ncbi:MAG: carbohydrate-binding domain-containing protein [Lachnospiraceae bacterium]|nr:carbohydrate-binding domain-containing protein [Lachnospiraceae bacterium]